MGTARALLLEAQSELRGNPAALLDIPLGLGLVCAFDGELDQARGYFEQTQRAADDAGDHWRSAEASFALTRMALAAGDAPAARRNAAKAVQVSQHLAGGHEPASASGLLALAELMAAGPDEETDAAERRFAEATEELERLEARWRRSVLLVLRAELELSRGRFAEALRYAEAGLPERVDDGIIKLSHCRVVQAEASLGLGRIEAAAQFAAEASAERLSARMRARLATVRAALEERDSPRPAHTVLQTAGG